MTTCQVALGSLSLLVLQSCASGPGPSPMQHVSYAVATHSSEQGECPPLFGKVCYGPTDRPEGMMRCGCSTVSPLGTPYP
jgi:hypothetical protein